MTKRLLHIRQCQPHISVQKDCYVMQRHWMLNFRISSPEEFMAAKAYSI